jgi:hypothetical protein
VHLAVTAAFIGTGAAESDAIRQLRFEKLAMAGFVGAGHDIAGGIAYRGAIEIEPDACDQVRDVALGQAGVGAGCARFHAAKAGVDTTTHGVGVCGLFGVGAEHGADGDCGHDVSFRLPAAKPLRAYLVPIVTDERDRGWNFLPISKGTSMGAH